MKRLKSENGSAVVVALIIVILIMVVIIGLLLLDKYPQLLGKKENFEKVEITETEKETEKVIEPTVYEANYSFNFTKEYYNPTPEGYEGLAYAKDINVPYINIDSEDGKKANQEIKDLYLKLCNEYEEDLKLVNSDAAVIPTVKSNYKVYYNKGIVSVVITIERTDAERQDDNYLIYNFDIKTLKNLEYEGVYTKLGYTSASISETVKKVLSAKTKDEIDNSSPNKKTYKAETLEKYEENVNENKLQYYIDENGKLNIITTIYIPAGAGEYIEVITIN